MDVNFTLSLLGLSCACLCTGFLHGITMQLQGESEFSLSIRASVLEGPFMVMDSDARDLKEFSTENTLGGNFVLAAADDSFA